MIDDNQVTRKTFSLLHHTPPPRVVLPDDVDDTVYRVLCPGDVYGYEIHDGAAHTCCAILVGTREQLAIIGRRLSEEFGG